MYDRAMQSLYALALDPVAERRVTKHHSVSENSEAHMMLVRKSSIVCAESFI